MLDLDASLPEHFAELAAQLREAARDADARASKPKRTLHTCIKLDETHRKAVLMLEIVDLARTRSRFVGAPTLSADRAFNYKRTVQMLLKLPYHESALRASILTSHADWIQEWASFWAGVWNTLRDHAQLTIDTAIGAATAEQTQLYWAKNESFETRFVHVCPVEQHELERLEDTTKPLDARCDAAIAILHRLCDTWRAEGLANMQNLAYPVGLGARGRKRPSDRPLDIDEDARDIALALLGLGLHDPRKPPPMRYKGFETRVLVRNALMALCARNKEYLSDLRVLLRVSELSRVQRIAIAHADNDWIADELVEVTVAETAAPPPPRNALPWWFAAIDGPYTTDAARYKALISVVNVCAEDIKLFSKDARTYMPAGFCTILRRAL
jgi:hypothetical protein